MYYGMRGHMVLFICRLDFKWSSKGEQQLALAGLLALVENIIYSNSLAKSQGNSSVIIEFNYSRFPFYESRVKELNKPFCFTETIIFTNGTLNVDFTLWQQHLLAQFIDECKYRLITLYNISVCILKVFSYKFFPNFIAKEIRRRYSF